MSGANRAIRVSLLLATLALGAVVGQEGIAEEPAASGQKIFENNCSACHGQSGGGRLGPALRGNLRLADTRYLVARVMRGGEGMPAFAGRLETAEIAAVADQVATSWGNSFGEVTAALVANLSLGDPAEPEELYARNCSMCHMPDGGGFIGPRLAGNPRIEDASFVIEKIRSGGGGMPAFGGILDPERIAALVGYVRGSLSNAGGPVSADAVLEQADAGSEEDADGGGQHLAEVGEGGTALVDGETLDFYLSTCGPCHGERGGGGVGPPLSGNRRLADVSYLVSRIAMGGDGMPAFNLDLSSADVAALATLLRTAWGNDLGPVSVQDAKSWHSGDSRAVRLFSNNCAGCHGFAGRGYRGPGPPLARNAQLEDAGYVVRQIVFGSANMPAFGDELSPEQIAELATYLRTKWGNDFGPVEVEVVQRERSGR
jgi:mono/diheme cytochrome c family protein